MSRYDVVLFGGGVAGLMAAQKLSSLGMRTALVEQYSTLASGPSTRNEGWLHRGTYHAASITDRLTAIQVARRCIYGLEQLKRFAPEAVEGNEVAPYAMIKNADCVDEILSRWTEAGVQFKPVTSHKAREFVPGADLEPAAAIFEVADVSINTRLLYRKLVATARQDGCTFLLGHTIERIEGGRAVLKSQDGTAITVEANAFIYSTGIGTKNIFQQFHGSDLPIRYWKSHLVVTGRIAPAGLFYVDPHEAAMMHHGQTTIVGLNDDARLSDRPSYDIIPECAQNVRRAIKRIYGSWSGEGAVYVACTKVDLAVNTGSARSLNIAITEPIPGRICVLPGKMTEAPYLIDALASYLHHRLDSPDIAMRPCDLFQNIATSEREVA